MEARDAEENKTKVILLVEDEEAHAEFIRRVFEKDGPDWAIHHSANLNDARKWLEQHAANRPSLVISDYRLPDGNGLDLAKDAKTPEEIGFPLIILTGVGSEKLAVKTLRSGAMDYVIKGEGSLLQLPSIAIHVLREWDLIMERVEAENELKNFIRDLEEANSNLEDFLNRISKELESSVSSIQDFNKILSEKYAEKLDDNAINYLNKMRDAAERINVLLDDMFEYIVPIYFDSSLITLYESKLDRLKKDRQLTPPE
jgi:FixJ family two-component response regulator